MINEINYWFDTHGYRSKFRISPSEEVDVVVVGGGIAGISTLYWLLSHGIDAILLEENDVGFMASGRSNGCSSLPLLSNIRKEDLPMLYYMVKLNNLLITNIIAQEFLPCDLQHVGEIQIRANSTFKCANFTGNILTFGPKSINELLNCKNLVGATYLPCATIMNTYQFISGLLSVCEMHGSKIFSHANVYNIDSHNDYFVVHNSLDKQVKCNNIVLCTNSNFGIELPSKENVLYGACTRRIASSYLSDFPNKILTFMENNVRCRLYDDRLFIDFDEGLKDDVYCYLAQYFKFLKRYPLEYIWSSPVSSTKDGFPLIGNLDDNLFINGMHGHHGLSFAVLGGKIIADNIKAKTKIEDEFIFSPSRFKKEAINGRVEGAG